MPDIAPETAIAEVGNVGLGVDKQVRVNGVGDIERRWCSGVACQNRAMIGPSAGLKTGRSSEANAAELAAELRNGVVAIISVANFVDVRSPDGSLT